MVFMTHFLSLIKLELCVSAADDQTDHFYFFLKCEAPGSIVLISPLPLRAKYTKALRLSP